MRKVLRMALMTFSLLLLSLPNFSHAAAPIALNGAGASFPYPLYSQWAYDYKQLTGVELNYQSIGSGGGIKQIKAGTVDFGASDAPLTAKDLDTCGLIQFPMIMGGVVPVFHLEGIAAGALTLDGTTLADVYLGKVKQWNDPAIKKLNPKLNLPDKAITVIYRSDGSGTTWIFTNYLARVSAEWKEQVGVDKAVNWLVGSGGKGNEGVSAYVQQIDGSIGYVEFAYAQQNKLSYAQLINKSGKAVAPTAESFASAAQNADWAKAEGFYLVLVDQPGEQSWPITGASFIIIYRDQKDAQKADAMLKFFDWCYQKGQKTAFSLDYIPIPENVIEMVQKVWKEQLKSSGKPIWLVK